MNREAWEKRRQRDTEIIKSLRKGIAADQLALKFDLSVATIRNIGRPVGLTMGLKQKRERHRDIVIDFNDGMDEYKLAEKYDLSYERIRQILQSKVENYVTPGFRKTSKLYAQVCKGYKSGVKIDSLASKIKMSPTRVRQILQDAGLYQPVGRKPDTIRNRQEQIAEDLRMGSALLEICNKFRVGTETVRRIVYAQGMTKLFFASRKKRDQLILADLKRGAKANELALKYWTTPYYVKKLISRKGFSNSGK